MSTQNSHHNATTTLSPLGGFFDSFVRQFGGVIGGR